MNESFLRAFVFIALYFAIPMLMIWSGWKLLT
jgi:hypothetical protein